MDAVRTKLKQAILYIERNPKLGAPDTYCSAQPSYYFCKAPKRGGGVLAAHRGKPARRCTCDMSFDLGRLVILKMTLMKSLHSFQATAIEKNSHSKEDEEGASLERALEEGFRDTFPASDAVSVVQPAPPASRGRRE